MIHYTSYGFSKWGILLNVMKNPCPPDIKGKRVGPPLLERNVKILKDPPHLEWNNQVHLRESATPCGMRLASSDYHLLIVSKIICAIFIKIQPINKPKVTIIVKFKKQFDKRILPLVLKNLFIFKNFLSIFAQ